VLARLADLLRDGGVPAAGFLTQEIRESGRRAGFAVETLEGDRATLAHVRFRGPPRVGRYGVDLEAFERLVLPAVERCRRGRVALLDELGKMELASHDFRDAVAALFDRRVAIVATVMSGRYPVTDALKRRDDVELLLVTSRERDALPARLAERLRGVPP